MTYLILNLFIIQLAKKWIEDTPHQTNPQLYNICTLNDTFLSNELQFAQK